MIRTRIGALTLFVALLTASMATAEPARSKASTSQIDTFLRDVKRAVLPNGLTVVTREQKGCGVVAINTWVKAGYFNEPDEVAGMAHLFEHMFFKGSKKFPGAEQIMTEVASLGGQSNAGTIYDTTNYYFVLPKEAFRKGLEIQADAIMNPRFDPEELRKEAEVVIEESNRKFDNAPAVSLERMYATAFTEHRIKRWRIGSNEVLRGIRRESLLAFFETLYRPENIVLVITGDIPHTDVMRAVRETFGTIPKGTLKKGRGPREPKQDEFRFGQSSADIRTSYSVFGWHTPGANDPDELVLDVLGGILGGGRSSRLFRNAVAPEAASEVDAFHMTFDDVGLFQVSASFSEKNRAESDRRVLREVERLRKSGPTRYELQLAKNQIESQKLFALETVLDQAESLGNYEVRGGYLNLKRDLDRLAALTPENIRDAAQRYLVTENLTLYHYQPNGATALSRDEALGRVRAAISEPMIAEADLEPPAAPVMVAAATSARAQQTFDLANGAKLVVRENPGAPTVSLGIFFRGGCLDENSSNAGITKLMARTLRRGTLTKSGEQIDRDIEFLGTQIGTPVSEDYFGVTLNILRRSLRPGVGILADVVLNPSFPEDGIAKEKDLQSAAIRRSFDSSAQRPLQLLQQALYGNHPYALPTDGYLSSVAALDRDAVRSWWETQATADDALIVVVGDVATNEAKQIIEAAFAELPRRKGKRTAALHPVPPATRMEVVESRDRKQTAITIAFPTVPASHEDFVPLRVLQGVTSGLSGTFGIELRGKRSLAYTVFTRAVPLGGSGSFLAYLASEAKKEGEAKEGLLSEFRKLLTADGIREEDAARARSLILGSTRIGLQANAPQVSDLARGYYVGGALDATDRLLARVPSITVNDLVTVAKKYLAGENWAAGTLRGKSE